MAWKTLSVVIVACLGWSPALDAGELSRAADAASPLWPSGRLQVLESPVGAARTSSPVASSGPRSMYKAALLSAVVPGLGQAYAGHKNRALLFGVLEGGVWLSYATFKFQEDLRGDRAQEFAVAAAGASPVGDDEYYSAVGQFLRSDGPGMWNEFVRRRLRDTGESVGREYDGEFSWAWPSREQFERYRSLRRRELEAGDNATDMIAVAILNRLASVVDVVLAMRRDAQVAASQQRGVGLSVRLGRRPGQPLARVGLRHRF